MRIVRPFVITALLALSAFADEPKKPSPKLSEASGQRLKRFVAQKKEQAARQQLLHLQKQILDEETRAVEKEVKEFVAKECGDRDIKISECAMDSDAETVTIAAKENK